MMRKVNNTESRGLTRQNKEKKVSTLLKTGALALSFTALLWTINVRADVVNVNITGLVIAPSCTINPVLVAGQPVSLGSPRSDTLQNSGDADPVWNNFTLELTHCPLATSSSTVTFTGTPDADDASLFANTEPVGSAASNVAIEISRQSDHSAIISNGSTLTERVATVTRTVSFPLAARIKTPTGNVTGGAVSASVLVDFTYN